MNCSSRVNSHFTGCPGLQCGEHAEILGQHLLLTAKPAANPLGEYVNVPRPQTENVANFLLSDERGLGAGADMDAPIG